MAFCLNISKKEAQLLSSFNRRYYPEDWGCYGSLALPGAHLEGKTVHKSSSLIGSFIAATIKAMVY